jgi:hypothetical protein
MISIKRKLICTQLSSSQAIQSCLSLTPDCSTKSNNNYYVCEVFQQKEFPVRAIWANQDTTVFIRLDGACFYVLLFCLDGASLGFSLLGFTWSLICVLVQVQGTGWASGWITVLCSGNPKSYTSQLLQPVLSAVILTYSICMYICTYNCIYCVIYMQVCSQ